MKVITCLVVSVSLMSTAMTEELTPVGAEQAGNAAGTIPAWMGGMAQHPDSGSGIEPEEGYPNPFADDKPLYTITADNQQDYAAQLSAGHRALLRKYPSYQMRVYPTRRTAFYPATIDAASLANDGVITRQGVNFLSNNYEKGVPFRQPATGAEVILNHKFRYLGAAVERFNVVHAMTNTEPALQSTVFHESLWYGQPSPIPDAQHVAKYLMRLKANPDTHCNRMALVHDFKWPSAEMDVADDSRGTFSWIYRWCCRACNRPPLWEGNRKVLSEVDLMYVDQIDMFRGDLAHYDFQLQGKQEILVPYNAFALLDQQKSYSEILHKQHLNPQLTRYELHRVWVVGATLKDEAEHFIQRRRFYVDEDSWTILMVDVYDQNDKLWRFQEGHAVTLYLDNVGVHARPHVVYDLHNGHYMAEMVNNELSFDLFNQHYRSAKMFQSIYMKRWRSDKFRELSEH